MSGRDTGNGYRIEESKTDSRISIVDCNHCSWWARFPTYAAHKAAQSHLRREHPAASGVQNGGNGQ